MTSATQPLDTTDSGAPLMGLRSREDAFLVDELGAQIVGMAGRLAAATCRWLLMVAQFDAHDGAVRFVLPSTSRWLAHNCGIARRTASEHVRVARALAAFPALASAMGSGRLSYSHVRVIAGLAEDGEQQLVADLIHAAEHGTIGQLEVMVRGLRTAATNEAGEIGPPLEYVRHSWTAASQWSMAVRLEPSSGAIVEHAIDLIARAEGLTATSALARLAELAIVSTLDSDHPPRPLRGDERAAVVIHLDSSAVPSAVAAAPEAPNANPADRSRPCARIHRGPGLSPQVVERLLCQGRVRTAVHDAAGNVAVLGRSHRVVSDRQFRALLLRDSSCTFPGCGSRERLEAHHVRHWLHGGPTDLTNLVLLCWRHHHAHHDGFFRIDARHPRVEFTRHDGLDLSSQPSRIRSAGPAGPIESEYLAVAPTAARSRWTGERLDRHYAVSVLAQRRHEVARLTACPGGDGPSAAARRGP